MINDLDNNASALSLTWSSMMRTDGYLRIASAIPRVKIADVAYNCDAIIQLSEQAESQGASIVVFPELSLSAYTCADLFHQCKLREDCIDGLKRIANSDVARRITIVVGLPLLYQGALYNCAAVVDNGAISGIVPKSFLPNYGEYYEKRWFTSGASLVGKTLKVGNEEIPFGVDLLFRKGAATFAIEICEDLWVPIPPSSYAALKGANLILNLSATNEVVGKNAYLLDLIKQQSARLRAAYMYSSAGFGESSTDLVFSGNAVICENGKVLGQSQRFAADSQIVLADVDLQLLDRERSVANSFADCSYANDREYLEIELAMPNYDERLTVDVNNHLLRPIKRYPFVPEGEEQRDARCREIINIQSEGLKRRLAHLGNAKAVIGISGGLDSTLALLVTVEAFDRLKLPRTNIYAITMPGFGTTSRTKTNADTLMRQLGVTALEISIAEAARQHLKDIDHSEEIHDATYENAQARERTQILMDYANKVGGIVIGTGDLSELALGWCTYNGDHMSMYGVNGSIPKTLVRHLVKWFVDVATDEDLKLALLDVLDTPVSPELIPADSNDNIVQKTEDLVGPYELHDFFIYNYIRHGYSPNKIYRLALQAFAGEYPDDVIEKWLRTFMRRFYSQQFKRSCMPDGPKVGSVCFSPRGDWRMPSDV